MKDRKFWISLIAGLLAVVMLLSLVMSILPTLASAAKTSDTIKDQIAQMQKENEKLEAQVDSLQDQMAALKAEQKDNLTEISGIIEQKTLIDQEIGLMYAQVSNINEQIAAYNVLIADKQEEVEEAEQRLAELNAKYKERIRAMEEDGNISYWSVLLEANSFFELLDRLNMVQEIAEADSRRLQELRDAAAEVEAARQVLLTERDSLNEAKAALEAVQEELLLKSTESEEMLNELTAKMEELEQQADAYYDTMADYEAALEELEVSIGKAEVDLDKALYEEYMATMTTAPPPTTSPSYGHNVIGGTTNVDESGITWVVPCSYKYVSSAFGWRKHPVYGDRRFHNGVDFAAPCLMKKDGTTDSPILATRSGVVIAAQYNKSAGWYVTIDHLDGYRSTYMHMCCKPFVKTGDVVGAGQVIGCIGTTGTSTGNHLHFGIYKNGQAVNPMDYVG